MTNPTDRIAGLMASPPEDELAAWMVQYGPALRRFFVRKAGQSCADDLVQEVFLRLQARADDTPFDNVEGYLFTVAKHVLVDRIRADASRLSLLHDSLDEAADTPDEISPERILAAKQEIARAIHAIAELPPRVRTAFMLHRFGKLSYSAIAKRMKISKPLVQKLMRRAIERLVADMESGR